MPRPAKRAASAAPDDLPGVSPFLQDGFHRFLRPFLRRHFHTIAVDRDSRPLTASIPTDEPVIVFGNHPSWWDPLIAHLLCQTWFPPRQFYAPIDADALAKYPVFGKLGFFGVRVDTPSGAAVFLRTCRRLLESPQSSLWVTPEGRFADVRDDSAPLAPGLAHLCTRERRGFVLPLAMEYVFWEERLPECLIRFGEPLALADHDWSKTSWQETLTARLRSNQAALAKRVIARDSDAFEPVLTGSRGAGGFYDTFRRLRSWLSGSRFHAEHGDKFH